MLITTTSDNFIFIVGQSQLCFIVLLIYCSNLSVVIIIRKPIIFTLSPLYHYKF